MFLYPGYYSLIPKYIFTDDNGNIYYYSNLNKKLVAKTEKEEVSDVPEEVISEENTEVDSETVETISSEEGLTANNDGPDYEAGKDILNKLDIE